MYSKRDTTESVRLGSDGKLHRSFKKVYPNGDVYDCEFSDGKPNGRGIYTSKELTYVGDFHKGLFHGDAEVKWTNEENQIIKTFEGTYVKGFISGQGEMIWYQDEQITQTYTGEFLNNQFSGAGELVIKDHEVQKGMFVNGKLHCEDGYVRYDCSGDEYRGPVRFGKKHGAGGTYTFKAGGRYVGEFRLDEMHGLGSRYYADGLHFRGGFANNSINGNGCMVFNNPLDDKEKYVGEMVNGILHGNGTLTFRKNSKYQNFVGEFKAGLFHKGTLLFRDKSTYDGSFQKGLFEGSGTRTWANGSYFEGQFKDGFKVEGKYHDSFNNSTYVGSFLRGKKHGSGKEIWKGKAGSSFFDPVMGWKHETGTFCKYSGEYEYGFCHGEGIFSAPDSRYYEGQWHRNKPHGRGKMLLMVGSSSIYRPKHYNGEWTHGVKDGKGTLTFSDGNSKEVTFKNGHRVV